MSTLSQSGVYASSGHWGRGSTPHFQACSSSSQQPFNYVLHSTSWLSVLIPCTWPDRSQEGATLPLPLPVFPSPGPFWGHGSCEWEQSCEQGCWGSWGGASGHPECSRCGALSGGQQEACIFSQGRVPSVQWGSRLRGTLSPKWGPDLCPSLTSGESVPEASWPLGEAAAVHPHGLHIWGLPPWPFPRFRELGLDRGWGAQPRAQLRKEAPSGPCLGVSTFPIPFIFSIPPSPPHSPNPLFPFCCSLHLTLDPVGSLEFIALSVRGGL